MKNVMLESHVMEGFHLLSSDKFTSLAKSGGPSKEIYRDYSRPQIH